MATEYSSNTTPAPQMTPAELSALATRLRNRADSVVLRDCPHQQADLRTAALVIEQLVQLHADIRATAAATDGIKRLLALVEGR
jgi:hypothetical protein